MKLPTTWVPWNIDAGDAPVAKVLDGAVARDIAIVAVALSELDPGDTVVQASFTAKLAATDADDAVTTVQRVYRADDPTGGLNPTVTAIGTRACMIEFPLLAADTAKLTTEHGYDVRVWVDRPGVGIIPRTVMTGTIVAEEGWTSLDSSADTAPMAIVLGSVSFSGAATSVVTANVSLRAPAVSATPQLVAGGGASDRSSVASAPRSPAAGQVNDRASVAGAGTNGVFVNYRPGDPLATHGMTFARASTAVELDDVGTYRVKAVDVIRDNDHVVGALGTRLTTVGAARTNRCQRNYLHAGGTTGWTKAGDAAATLTAVTDATELANAGLSQEICTDNYVLKLDNSAGVAVAYAENAGTVGSTSASSFGAFIRGGTGEINLGGSNALAFVASTPYVYVRQRNITPGATSEKLRIQADAGQVVYFVLGQLIVDKFVGNPIPNSSGGSVTKAAEDWYIATPAFDYQQLFLYCDTTERHAFTSADAGTVLMRVGGNTFASPAAPSVSLTPNNSGTGSRCLAAGTSTSTNTSASAAPVFGDRVEAMAAIDAAGSFTPRARLSVNAAAEVTTTTSGGTPVPATFGTPRFVRLSPSGSLCTISYRRIIIGSSSPTIAAARAFL